MIVSKAITAWHQNRVGAAHSGSEVAMKFDVWVICCLTVLRIVGIDQDILSVIWQVWLVLFRAKWKGDATYFAVLV
jgi:hypothetical protein